MKAIFEVTVFFIFCSLYLANGRELPLQTNASKELKEGPIRPMMFPIGVIGNKYYFTEDIRTSWAGTLDLCHRYGYQMATVDSSAENTMLRNFLQSGYLTRITFFWLGGSDLFNENDWRWLRTGTKMTYTNWASGHPKVGDTAWNCVAMSSVGGWQNQNCSDLSPESWLLGPLCEQIITEEQSLVTLVEGKFFEGSSVDVHIDRSCFDLEHVFDQKTSSIRQRNGATCVQIYEERYCEGKSTRIKGDFMDLDELQFNKKAKSIGPCLSLA